MDLRTLVKTINECSEKFDDMTKTDEIIAQEDFSLLKELSYHQEMAKQIHKKISDNQIKAEQHNAEKITKAGILLNGDLRESIKQLYVEKKAPRYVIDKLDSLDKKIERGDVSFEEYEIFLEHGHMIIRETKLKNKKGFLHFFNEEFFGGKDK